jgi:hypothetical protein
MLLAVKNYANFLAQNAVIAAEIVAIQKPRGIASAGHGFASQSLTPVSKLE